jgi:hypothetical protein
MNFCSKQGNFFWHFDYRGMARPGNQILTGDLPVWL